MTNTTNTPCFALLAALLSLVCGTGGAAQPDKEGVYFLGVDSTPILGELPATETADRWAFSDLAREAFDQAEVANLAHSLADWRPLEDPFNVGVLVLTNLTTSSVDFRGSGYRYFSTAELVWLHVGQDRQGVGMARPFPEVRGVITHQYTATGEGTEPFGEADLAELKLAAIREGITQMAGHIAAHQARSVIRNALDIRYVTVTPAELNDRARADLARSLEISGDREAREFEDRIARIFESMVMQEVSKTDALKNIVVLPGKETLDALMDLWPQYARRVFALSSHSGARRALGEEPPHIRIVAESCGADRDPRLIPVRGWHVRTTLAALQVKSENVSDYVSGDHVQVVVAAAIREPLAKDTHAGPKRRIARGSGRTEIDWPLLRPSELSTRYSLNDYTLGILLKKGMRAAMPEIIEQLRVLDTAAVRSIPEGEVCNEQA